jgi:hypothetical protein
LKNCRRAIRANGTPLLLETVLIPPSSDPASALMDLLMMVLTGGRERTEAEFRSLLEEAGFERSSAKPPELRHHGSASLRLYFVGPLWRRAFLSSAAASAVRRRGFLGGIRPLRSSKNP